MFESHAELENEVPLEIITATNDSNTVKLAGMFITAVMFVVPVILCLV